MAHVDMWTDGACSGNPGPGGWAAVLQYGEHEREVVGGTTETTNNRAELMAVIVGLEALKFACEVTIHTDSQYVIGMLSLGWKRKANHDLLVRADTLMAKHTVSFEHVKGHSGDAMNERCDALAKAEVEKQRSKVEAAASSPTAKPLCKCEFCGAMVVNRHPYLRADQVRGSEYCDCELAVERRMQRNMGGAAG